MFITTLRKLLITLLLSTLGIDHAFATEYSDAIITKPEYESFKLQQNILSLTARIQELEKQPVITPEKLRQKKIQRLKEIAADVKLQRQATGDFQGFVTWMSTNLAGYNKYILAGSYAALIARVLPIPYAGQASIFTKFVAQFTIALNNASLSILSLIHI